MNPGSEVVTFDIIPWRAQMILHLQKLVSRDSTDRVEAVHTAKMVLRGFAMLISLYKVIFWKLHNKGEKHKNRFGNLVPTLAMEVRDHCLLGFEDVVARGILVVTSIFGKVDQLDVVRTSVSAIVSLIGL